MNNQSSGNGGATPKLQAMVEPPSTNIGGQGPATDTSASAPAPTDVSSPGGAPGPMAPDSAKGGHLTAPK